MRANPRCSRRTGLVLNVGRREQRILSRVGLMPVTRSTLALRAATICWGTWDWMSHHPVVIWVDNFYNQRNRIGPNAVDVITDCMALPNYLLVILEAGQQHWLSLQRCHCTR